MTHPAPILGVYLSETLDLEDLYGAALTADDVQILRPDQVTDPQDIRFALCWLPGPRDFEGYPNLSLAMSIGAGVDALLAHPGLSEDIAIARVRDLQQAALMAGFAAHEVLHYERDFGQMMQNAQGTQWRPLPMRAPELSVVAVLGNGTMGQAVVEALNVLGFTMQVASRSAPNAPLEGVRYFTGDTANKDAAKGADYVINVLPLTSATEDVLNAELFDGLNPGARLIQIGRGEHLVENDLLTALETGQLAGATLDVFRTEPLPQDHPFWSDPRLRITPHIASDTMPEVVTAQVVETARALRDGTPLRLAIARSRGY
ncbi:hydroxyacid dehydrogenase [Epibacterium ulvae]|uniref:NAD(P)-dependent oxidoreductase n=1 Tax=Epibacterium ulvae TaxID=1156985 RepID=UPI001BFC6415|nr:NAD(P)-dependent oxidoreductase [Epibacterium ulvae]MBT8153082.1 hydroxyacid dehydrogenase [Epibacterium ulvae]